jgi:hypothetical protein
VGQFYFGDPAAKRVRITSALTLTVKLLDPAGSEIATRTYASGEKKGGSYMISGSPEEKISKLTHEVIAELMQKSLVDIRAWAAAHPRTQ